MNARKSLRRILLAAALLGASLIVDARPPTRRRRGGSDPVGRWPVSRAGRRGACIRRSTIFVATLPPSCSTIVIEGTTLQQCGGTYYQSSGNQYVVVNVD